MSDNNTTFNYRYNETEKLEIISINLLKMLKERNLLKDYDKLVNQVFNNLKNKNSYDIKLDNKDRYDVDVYSIMLLNDNINNLSKSSVFSSILSKYNKKVNTHIIIIVEDIKEKIREKILLQFNNIEIFKKIELMMNLVDHMYIPKHILLTDEEKNIFYKEYNVSNEQMQKISIFDPVSRYYNAKKNDIFRIIRSSDITGTTFSYRLVINLSN